MSEAFEAARRHAEQVAYWNGPAAERWVAHQMRLDVAMAEIARLTVAAGAPSPGETVLDVGCGAGATAALAAERVGPSGRVVGLDISQPLIERARLRLAGLGNVELLLADAARAELGGIAADLVLSRFGVMFFGEPVEAFRNLKRALKPGGRLAFSCWRKPAENPWMMVPLAAVTPYVPPQPRLGPEDPGPFSFSDPARVGRILEGAGFAGTSFEPVDLALDLAGGQGFEGAVSLAQEIGAASRALEGVDSETRRRAVAALRTALEPYRIGETVPLGAAIWLVRARAG